MPDTIAQRREEAPLYHKLRGALEASGLPVVTTGYVLRFPVSSLTFNFTSTFDRVYLTGADSNKGVLTSIDKNILAVALLLGIEKRDRDGVFRR